MAQLQQDPGLGSSYKRKIKRMINKDGSYNIIRHGALSGFQDFYKHLIDLKWRTFFLVSILAYIVINILFAFIYMGIGVDHIMGADQEAAPFIAAFFFSFQTFTTVGYGFLSPTGVSTGIIAAIEAFIGLMYFALITGLLYGRFSRPSSKVEFSQKILLVPFQEGKAVMFKIVNKRKTVLLNAKVKCLLSIDEGTGDDAFNKEYHQIELEIDQVNFFPLTWTIVHKVDSESPFNELTLDDLIARNAEMIVLFEAFEETFSQTVMQKHSFGEDQWSKDFTFERNFKINENGQIELFIHDLNKMKSI